MIKSFRIVNFRSLKDVNIPDVGDFLVVGRRNGAGTSNILGALNLFFNGEIEPGAALDLGNEDGVMPREKAPGKPTTRRYTDSEKHQAVRLVRKLRDELGTSQGTVQRVASQLGYGVESVRAWVRERDVSAMRH